MHDPYPATFSIEIDRPRLKTYFRVKWFLEWVTPLCSLGVFIGALLRYASLTKHHSRAITFGEGAMAVVTGAAIGFAVTFILAFLIYLLRSHRLARRHAENLELSVEGGFLRLRQNVTVSLDRKLHFRSIVDYEVAQDSLMRRFGIYVLQMTVVSGAPLIVHGVKDCTKIRDMLSEIDRLRENL